MSRLAHGTRTHPTEVLTNHRERKDGTSAQLALEVIQQLAAPPKPLGLHALDLCSCGLNGQEFSPAAVMIQEGSLLEKNLDEPGNPASARLPARPRFHHRRSGPATPNLSVGVIDTAVAAARKPTGTVAALGGASSGRRGRNAELIGRDGCRWGALRSFQFGRARQIHTPDASTGGMLNLEAAALDPR